MNWLFLLISDNSTTSRVQKPFQTDCDLRISHGFAAHAEFFARTSVHEQIARRRIR